MNNARGWVTVAILVAGCGGGDGDEAAPSEETPAQGRTAASKKPIEETLARGLIAELPRFGTMTWRCAGDRFAVRLQRPRPIASIDLSVTADGEPLVENKQVNRAYETPLVNARSQSWEMVWHHNPARKEATVRLRFATSSFGDCFIRNARTSVTTDPIN